MRKSMSTAVKQDESGHNRMLEIGGVQIFSALVCLCWNSQASVYSTSVKNEHHYKKLANKTKKKEKKCYSIKTFVFIFSSFRCLLLM